MKLWAISDVHVGHRRNRVAMQDLPAHPDDWLILGGDVCEGEEELAAVLETACARYTHVVWVPGNHELWTTRKDAPRGQRKYHAMVEVCRRYGVQTPEDPYRVFESEVGRYLIAPLFLLYDYSFSPKGMSPDEAIAWAMESGILCADEKFLHYEPFESRQAWCAARVLETERRLQLATEQHDCPLVLINHFPLRQELAWLPTIPRFSIWCGTRQTEQWHKRFRAELVVFGHLHIRQRRMIDGVRFEEVSLGYPKQWRSDGKVERYLRQLLPALDEAPVRY